MKQAQALVGLVSLALMAAREGQAAPTQTTKRQTGVLGSLDCVPDGASQADVCQSLNLAGISIALLNCDEVLGLSARKRQLDGGVGVGIGDLSLTLGASAIPTNGGLDAGLTLSIGLGGDETATVVVPTASLPSGSAAASSVAESIASEAASAVSSVAGDLTSVVAGAGSTRTIYRTRTETETKYREGTQTVTKTRARKTVTKTRTKTVYASCTNDSGEFYFESRQG